MKKKILLSFLLLTLVKTTSVFGQSDIRRIRELIQNTPKINVANPSADPNGDIITPRQSVGYSGSGSNRVERFEEKRKLTKTLEKFVAFNPNADALYPGAIVQGKSLPDGILSPIQALRNPLKITITDLVPSNPPTSYTRKVRDPDLGNINDAINEMLNQNLETAQPAKVTYTETIMSSVEEGFLKLGASFKWATGNVSGSFQSNSSSYKTSLMVRFVQSYYTVSCEAPSDPASFFTRRTSFDDFSNYSGEGNPTTYVSSVTYGRELWMLIESNNETNIVKATLNAAFSSGFTSGSADLTAEQKRVLNESSIQILILGGAGSPAIEVVAGDHVSKLKEYLLAGANYSKTSPGVIISYTIRYLKDNEVARVSSSTDYTIKTSQASPEDITLTGISVTWNTGNDGKDWNTQPVIDVYDKNNRHVGHIDCCSADRNNDVWNNGRSETRGLSVLVGGLKIEDFSSGHFSAGRNARGNDDWDYTAIIHLKFSNGQTIDKSCSGRNGCGGNW